MELQFQTNLLDNFKQRLRRCQPHPLRPRDPNRPHQSSRQLPLHHKSSEKQSKMDDQVQTSVYIQTSPFRQEILNHLLSQQTRFLVQTQRFARQSQLNPSMRAVLIDWLVDVSAKFKLSDQSLFLAVNIVDRFIQAKTISRRKFQLLGISAMLVASKMQQIYAPQIKDLVYTTEFTYSKQEIIEMEGCILSTLEFDLTYVSPLSFLEHLPLAALLDLRLICFARYILHLALLHADLGALRPSQLARSSFLIARKVLKGCKQQGESKDWACVRRLLEIVVSQNESKLSAIRRKFSSERQCCVSQMMIEFKH